IWFNNVPRTKLAEVKGHQNWVKVTGEYLTFPGGGTQFKNGALRYIDHIQTSFPDIKWGKRTRVILDVGCGVASFGGYLFERDVISMSFAPKDEHEAQVQFALERGIPAISAVMGTQRLPFPSKIFDAIHCARCRVPWHIEGGKLLLELNRLLRPGGYFVWSATPVYQQEAEDVEIWEAMSKLTKAMCWELVVVYKDTLNQVGAAIYRKPTTNECYENRQQNDPPLCKNSDDPDAIWNVELQACMHKIPVDSSVRGSNWPKMWPERLDSPPYWLKSTETGVYGKPAPEDFTDDYKHWKNVVTKSYLKGLGIDWSSVRNVMDMRSIYGGFAAALRDLNVWVMNVVPLDSPDTLPIIYERGLFGIYHNWCESFSTYPRTYDLLHADHLFSRAKKRCKLESVIAEVDRILRPEGKLIVRDNIEIVTEIENMVKSMHWNVRLSYNKEKEGLLCVEKTLWRPTEGKYSRVDKKSSCSAATVLVVIGVCLVCVWIFMSAPVISGQNPNIPVPGFKTDTKAKLSQNPSSQFEYNSSDLPEDIMKDGVDRKTTQDEKISNGDGDNNNEEPVSINEDFNKLVPETNMGNDFGSNESKKFKSVSMSEDENSSSDTNETETFHKLDKKPEDSKNIRAFLSGDQSAILKETQTANRAFSTQAAESASEKESQKQENVYKWKICNVTTGPDFMPCLDNIGALRKLCKLHYGHRGCSKKKIHKRHCPAESPTCLVALPKGYKIPIRWPRSRDQIWFNNVPRTKLAEVKGHQNWVKVTGEYLTFPGGGTQFKNGALNYIDHIQKSLPAIEWGKRTRVILDVGCGVASFGGYLFERDVIAMSFAPKDEHEAQVQFALERGIPAISAVMGTQRLPFPSNVFDSIHCARCRVPWHVEGGKLLLELNRLIRPGGYFVWSATPVYQKEDDDVEIWEAMSKLTKAMCWELVVVYKDTLNQVGAAIYRKPTSNDCYKNRQQNDPPLCKFSDDPNAIWNVELQACMHKIPVDSSVRGSNWPKMWPERLGSPPYWLKSTETGVYGKPAPEDFTNEYTHWKNVVTDSYLSGLGIDWSSIRNVMDMRSIYGGFAAALRDLNVWVMNVGPLDSPDTLPVIYERGLFGIYHNWCESFSTYPRTYDLLHADHLFSRAEKRCKLESVIAEVDRILRPEGKLIVHDNVDTITEIENMVRSMQWNVRLSYNKEKEGFLCVEKTLWRPTEGKYSRVDGKKSTFSTATVVVLIGVCLVGVWMFMPSSVILGQNPNIPVQLSKTDTNARVSNNLFSHFEENSGDLPEDAMKDVVNQETALDEKTRNGNGNDNSEEPASTNEDSNTIVPQSNTGDNYGSNEAEKSKVKSMIENENSSSDTNETETVNKEEQKLEDNINTEVFPAGDQSEIMKETQPENDAFPTQAVESASEKESQKQGYVYNWKTCNVTTGPDFIPCLDNTGAIKKLHSTLHYEHRERHCPAESPTCLVALPKGYKIPVRWPRSRDQDKIDGAS
nr:probable methyltransferase PMT24 [Tanacetum cinerariifolium]